MRRFALLVLALVATVMLVAQAPAPSAPPVAPAAVEVAVPAAVLPPEAVPPGLPSPPLAPPSVAATAEAPQTPAPVLVPVDVVATMPGPLPVPPLAQVPAPPVEPAPVPEPVVPDADLLILIAFTLAVALKAAISFSRSHGVLLNKQHLYLLAFAIGLVIFAVVKMFCGATWHEALLLGMAGPGAMIVQAAASLASREAWQDSVAKAERRRTKEKKG